jgi:hypothetical protein
MNKAVRLVVLSLLMGAIFSGILFWKIRQKNGEIPSDALSNARLSILEAKKLGADIHAQKVYTSAIFHYDSALRMWAYENDRMLFARNYESIKKLALAADSLARHSALVSAGVVDDAQTIFIHSYELLQRKIELLKTINSQFKTPEELNIAIRNLQAAFAELTLLQQKNDWVEGEKRSAVMLTQSSDLLDQSREFLNHYFAYFESWEKMAKETIAESRKRKNYAIIIDKTAEELVLYHAGRQIKTYPVELGLNWIGDKNYEGDKSTPEGSYYVINKKEGNQTKYYKALGINYPNELDKKRFTELKSNGMIEASKKIGGLIEIHGDGGKGYHWTDGCIALKNEDMDVVFRLVGVKTSVIIVGSLRPLEEIIDL